MAFGRAPTMLWVILATFIAASTVEAANAPRDIPIVCNQTGAWAQDKVQALHDAILKGFGNERLKVLEDGLKGSTQGFTGPQTALILSAFKFHDEMVQAAAMMQDYVLGLTCEEVAGILKVFSFSDDKLTALAGVVNLITDLENNQTIINAFTFSADKQKAQQLLADSHDLSCVYGDVTEERVQFLVDVSMSMSAKFTASNGQQFTRLSFVQSELNDVIRGQLRPFQMFNVFSYGGVVTQWQPGLVNATQANINSAVTFVGNLNFRTDGTNSYAALQTAFADPNVVAIYFLTDGQPTVGSITDPTQIINAVKSWNSKRETPVPVHCTAFLAGHYDGDNVPAAQSFMSNLAAATGGLYRSIQ